MSDQKTALSRKSIDSDLELLTLAQVCKMLSVGRTFIYENQATGKFPKSVKLSPGRRGVVRFIKTEILQYVAQKAAMRQENSHAK
jgi:predicted DNA-binding transcriptional regulator AlpA